MKEIRRDIAVSAERLKRFMEERGLTQYTLADSIYCSRTSISNWCRGNAKITPDSAQMIQKIHGIDAAWLMAEDIKEA